MLSLLALLVATASPAPTLPPAQHLPTIAVVAPNATLTLQVARTEPQRELGLMNYSSLNPRTGMVFVFDTDATVAFWMKDTLIPLDMIFVGADGRVRSISARVPVVSPKMPDEDIPLEQGQAKYVIELSSGEAAQDGIAPGTQLRGITTLSTSSS